MPQITSTLPPTLNILTSSQYQAISLYHHFNNCENHKDNELSSRDRLESFSGTLIIHDDNILYQFYPLNISIPHYLIVSADEIESHWVNMEFCIPNLLNNNQINTDSSRSIHFLETKIIPTLVLNITEPLPFDFFGQDCTQLIFSCQIEPIKDSLQDSNTQDAYKLTQNLLDEINACFANCGRSSFLASMKMHDENDQVDKTIDINLFEIVKQYQQMQFVNSHESKISDNDNTAFSVFSMESSAQLLSLIQSSGFELPDTIVNAQPIFNMFNEPNNHALLENAENFTSFAISFIDQNGRIDKKPEQSINCLESHGCALSYGADDDNSEKDTDVWNTIDDDDDIIVLDPVQQEVYLGSFKQHGE